MTLANELIDLDAQEQIQAQERESFLQQSLEKTPTVRLKVDAIDASGRLPESEKPCFSITTIGINTFQNSNKDHESSDDFNWVLRYANHTLEGEDDFVLGRCLGTQGINLIVKRLQNALIKKGFITTRIIVEPQDLIVGVLTLTVVPGYIRDIQFLDPKARITAWNTVPSSTNDLLNLRDIEQALENFKRIPTADADIQITPSTAQKSAPGDSDLVIDWKQRFPFRVNLSLDDSGSDSTGKYQGSATLSYDNLLGLSDLFYITFNNDLGGGSSGKRGSNGRAIHYSIPYGYWLFSLNSSENKYYQTIIGANQDYVYSGESNNQALKASRVVYRDSRRKTTLSVKGWLKASKNYIDDTEVQVQRRRTFGLDFGVQHQEFIGRATLNVSLNYKRGYKGYGSLPAPEEPFGEGTATPDILTTQIQLNAPFRVQNQNMSYIGFLKAQAEGTRLVPQDKFRIGSRYTVRGFDGGNQLSAERGWLLRNDLNWFLGQTGQVLYAGLDYGRVSGPTSDNLVGTALSGAVIGLKGRYKFLSYDLFVGKPLIKPAKFTASDIVSGFSLNASF
ncbi:MAG: ShlB/FhaC/HecB family hemolysin secretion/activation protein [Thiomicrorhabdus sp.]|nr:ShlB/FhaC/HecB family hemolysin secretion/activation protein [Thiomicrorhabdus sp.]